MGCSWSGAAAKDDGPVAEAEKRPPTEDVAETDNGEIAKSPPARVSVAFQARELLSTRDNRNDYSHRRRSSAPFDRARIGTHTRHGIAPQRNAPMGKAKINQDRGLVVWPFNGSYNQALMCIFDGHGSMGEKVSEWCMQKIPGLIEDERDLLASSPKQCLEKCIKEMDQKLRVRRAARRRPANSRAPRWRPAPCPALS